MDDNLGEMKAQCKIASVFKHFGVEELVNGGGKF